MMKVVDRAPRRPVMRWVLTVVGLLCLLVAGLRYTAAIENSMDIAMSDESSYIYRGVATEELSVPTAGPLYALWYRGLAQVSNIQDRIDLFYLNTRLMTLLPPLLVFVALRLWRRDILLSLLVAAMVLLTQVNLQATPKVGHLGVILVLVAVALAALVRRNGQRWPILALGALLGGYVRPELFALFGILAVMAVIDSLRQRRWPDRMAWGLWGGVLLLMLWLFSWIGIPSDPHRSYVAFGQHFTVNWVLWNDSDLYPWTAWEQVLAQEFGEIDGVTDAILANPQAVARHVWTNIKVNSPPVAQQAVITSTSGLISPYILIGVVAITFLWRGLSLARRQWQWERRNGIMIAFGLAVLALSAFQVLMVYPRPHYILLPLTVGLMTVALAIPTPRHERFEAILALPLVLALLTLPTDLPYTGVYAGNNHTATVRTIQELALQPPAERKVCLFEAEGGLMIYLGDEERYCWVADYEKQTGFDEFLTERDLGVIVVSRRMQTRPHMQNDVQWHQFEEGYAARGFTRVEINTERYLYVRNDLMEGAR